LSLSVRLPEAFGFLWDKTADDGLPVRYRAGFGGRGSAKSHSFCSAAVLKGAERPLRIGVYREIQKSIRDSAKRLLDDKIAEHGLSAFYESTDTEIRGRNGTLFLFNGLRTNPDAIKSTEGIDIALVMEANTVAQRSWDLLIPTVRKPGSEIWAEWNPNLPTDPVDVMFRGEAGPPPGSIVRQVNWNDNPWFPAVLKAELEYDRKRDPEKYAHVWLGEYQRNSEARVFKNWTVEEFEAPTDAVHRFGADWGFAIDPTVLVRCHIVGRKLFVDYEAYMVGCEIDNTPALFDSIPESRRYLITADSARPETVSYMQRNGFPKIVPAIKGAGSVEDGVEFLKNYDIVVHPRCQHVVDELTLYSYKVDKLTGAVLPTLDDKANHTIDALRYACEGARRAGASAKDDPEPEFHGGEHSWML
jgi:phage terminase large subunit